MLRVHEPRRVLLQARQVTTLACIFFLNRGELLSIRVKWPTDTIKSFMTISVLAIPSQLLDLLLLLNLLRV